MTFGRRRIGGGYGWYDPETGEAGGVSVDKHRFFWMTAADHRRYVLMSTKAQGEGLLMCWDTEARKIVYEKRILDQATPGPIVEALPGGLVIGHTGVEGKEGMLYGIRADTGAVLWQKSVPQGPITWQSRVKRHAYSFRRGPDGHIWAYFGQALARINPVDANVEIVGNVPDSPEQLAFAGGRVDVAGAGHLRRIKDLHVRSVAPKP